MHEGCRCGADATKPQKRCRYGAGARTVGNCATRKPVRTTDPSFEVKVSALVLLLLKTQVTRGTYPSPDEIEDIPTGRSKTLFLVSMKLRVLSGSLRCRLGPVMWSARVHKFSFLSLFRVFREGYTSMKLEVGPSNSPNNLSL